MAIFRLKLFKSLIKTAKSTSRLANSLARTLSPPKQRRAKKVTPVRPTGLQKPKSRAKTVPTLLPAPGRKGDVFIAGRHTYRNVEHAFKVYFPPVSAQSAPAGLIVMLHGCKQNATDFAAGTRMNDLARDANLIVLYPEQSSRANAQRCWNWFDPVRNRRGQGEPAWIASLTKVLVKAHKVPSRHTFIAGLSAGGAMAITTAQAYPEIFAACGVHSGVAPGSARGVLDAMSVMRSGAPPWRSCPQGTKLIPTIVFHGDRDRTVSTRHASNVVVAALGDPAASGLKPAEQTQEEIAGTEPYGRNFTRIVSRDPKGRTTGEKWIIHGMGHAWSGGSTAGTYIDSTGPSASEAMLRFFLKT
jgi:poly(hydroxyalkanoate) depolymerase family esterase